MKKHDNNIDPVSVSFTRILFVIPACVRNNTAKFMPNE